MKKVTCLFLGMLLLCGCSMGRNISEMTQQEKDNLKAYNTAYRDCVKQKVVENFTPNVSVESLTEYVLNVCESHVTDAHNYFNSLNFDNPWYAVGYTKGMRKDAKQLIFDGYIYFDHQLAK